ncbi:MAG: hypothetical protein IJH05_09055 [Firmicutes bacterium]|nr:hypothetical protein [Bacillota bacterium]
MKKQMLEKKGTNLKSKLMAMFMAATMVFAMVPLGAGVAFAEEEDIDAADAAVAGTEETVEEAAGDVVFDVEEDAVEAAAVEEAAPAVEEADGEVSAAAINKGYITIDMSTGTKVCKYTKEDLNAIQQGTGEIPVDLMAIQMILGFENMGLINSVNSEEEQGELFDLDQNGSYDILITQSLDATQTYAIFTITKLGTCSIKKEISLAMPKEFQDMVEEQLGPNEEYYMGLKFVFVKTPVAKKANTLTLKAKKTTTVKIKYKKLKKKAQSFAISKVLTVSRAQGNVTYKKLSGNKKITVSSKGKVTVGKKLKKGTYTVKVNVTASGNASFNKMTKTAVFKVKVK